MKPSLREKREDMREARLESRDIELLYVFYSCQNTVLMCSNAEAALWKLLPNAPVHVSFAMATAVSGNSTMKQTVYRRFVRRL
jgi:hypothetical protein